VTHIQFDRLLKFGPGLVGLALAQMAQTFSAKSKIIGKIIEDRKLEKAALETIYKKGRNISPSTLYEVFSPISIERLLLTAAKEKDGSIREGVTAFLTKLTKVKPLISGTDLINMGATPSAKMSGILKKLLYAQIDLKVATKEEAEDMAKKLLLGHKEGG